MSHDDYRADVEAYGVAKGIRPLAWTHNPQKTFFEEDRQFACFRVKRLLVDGGAGGYVLYRAGSEQYAERLAAAIKERDEMKIGALLGYDPELVAEFCGVKPEDVRTCFDAEYDNP